MITAWAATRQLPTLAARQWPEGVSRKTQNAGKLEDICSRILSLNEPRLHVCLISLDSSDILPSPLVVLNATSSEGSC